MSNLSYDALAVAGLKNVLEQVGGACRELEIDCFIVGAIARNIWYASHGEGVRGTQDIDFGVYVPDEDKYNQLRQKLIDEYAYQPSTTNAFCLITPDSQLVDLLPFGAIENKDAVMIQGQGLTKINLEGFKESYEMGLTETRIEEDIYAVCSIPAMMILKLIAYDDRPERRLKDVKDINSICQYYPDIEAQFIWENHADLYDENREHKDVAMIALGREIRKNCSKQLQSLVADYRHL